MDKKLEGYTNRILEIVGDYFKPKDDNMSMEEITNFMIDLRAVIRKVLEGKWKGNQMNHLRIIKGEEV